MDLTGKYEDIHDKDETLELEYSNSDAYTFVFNDNPKQESGVNLSSRESNQFHYVVMHKIFDRDSVCLELYYNSDTEILSLILKKYRDGAEYANSTMRQYKKVE